MTKEARLARGKENYDRSRFLNNSETIAYICVKDGGNWDDKNHVCIPKGSVKETPKDVKTNK